jgi:hypothetical protein
MYIECEGRYATKADELVHRESGNMPEFAAFDSREFWQAADTFERKNGQAYKEIEVALPRELDDAQRLELVREFVSTELENHAYTFAIHNKIASDGQTQPHAHIMFSTRENDGIERSREQYFKRANNKEPARGGCRKAECWSGALDKQAAHVEKIRGSWEKSVNHAYEIAGLEHRVSSKSLQEQGIDRVAEKHIGPAAAAIESRQRGSSRRVELNQSINAVNVSKRVSTEIAVVSTAADQHNRAADRAESSAAKYADMSSLKRSQHEEQTQTAAVQEKQLTAPAAAAEQHASVEPKVSHSESAFNVSNVSDPASESVSDLALEPEPEPEPAPRTSNEIYADMKRVEQQYAVTDQDRDAHKAAYMKPILDERKAINLKIEAYSRDFEAWKEKGKERGWKPDSPPLLLNKKEFNAWNEQGRALTSRATSLKAEVKELDRRVAATVESYHDKNKPSWLKNGKEESELSKLPAIKAEANSVEYRALKQEYETAIKQEIAQKNEKAPEISRGRGKEIEIER